MNQYVLNQQVTLYIDNAGPDAPHPDDAAYVILPRGANPQLVNAELVDFGLTLIDPEEELPEPTPLGLKVWCRALRTPSVMLNQLTLCAPLTLKASA